MHLRVPLYALLVLGSTPLWGAASTASKVQSMRYRRPEPPPPQNEFSVGFRYQFAPDVRFGGFGNVAYIPNPNDRLTSDGQGNPYRQTYSDGSIVADVVFVPGKNQNDLSTDGKTGNYTYYDPSQRGPDGSYVDFHRYSAVTDETNPIVVDADGGSSVGYELQYKRFFDRKRRFGMLVGFAFNGFNNNYEGTVNADLEVETFRYYATDNNKVPELKINSTTNEDGTTTDVPVPKPARPLNDGTLDRIDYPGTYRGTEVRDGAARVEVDAHLRSAVYNLRAGPSYDLKLGKKFELSGSLGLVTQYFSTEYRVSETLMLNESLDTQGLLNQVRPLESSVDEHWLFGAYADLTASYRMTRRVDFYIGFQCQTGGDVKTVNQERFAEVDYNTQLYMSSGFILKF